MILAFASPEAVSCGFIDRPNPNDGQVLHLLTAGVETLCVELSAIYGKYGKTYNVTPATVGEGGRYLASLLSDHELSPQMVHEVTAVLRDLGLHWKPL